MAKAFDECCYDATLKLINQLDREKQLNPDRYHKIYGHGHTHVNALSYFRDKTVKLVAANGQEKGLAILSEEIKQLPHIGPIGPQLIQVLFRRFYETLLQEAKQNDIQLPFPSSLAIK